MIVLAMHDHEGRIVLGDMGGRAGLSREILLVLGEAADDKGES